MSKENKSNKSNKTKIVLSMPVHAAEQIAKDPEAFVRYMKENGFPIESVNVQILDTK